MDSAVLDLVDLAQLVELFSKLGFHGPSLSE